MVQSFSFYTFGLLISLTAATSSGSIGCGKNLKTSLTPGGPSKVFNFDSNASKDPKIQLTRRVRIALPTTYTDDQPAPLVLAFHLKHRNGTSFERMTELSNNAINTNAITVFPDGADTVSLHWTGDPWAPHTDEYNDILFTSQLLDQISENFCVDRSRVYAAGMGNGGGLVHLLACDPAMSTRIAAFAIVAGAVYTDEAMNQDKASGQPLFNSSSCKPGRPHIPMIQLHGDEDELVSYHGTSFDGPTVPVQEQMIGWLKQNDCDATTSVKIEKLAGETVTKYSYECMQDGKPLVQHYVVHGMDHMWPLIEKEEGTEGFDGTSAILDFFGSYSLPAQYVPGAETKTGGKSGSEEAVEVKKEDAISGRETPRTESKETTTKEDATIGSETPKTDSKEAEKKEDEIETTIKDEL